MAKRTTHPTHASDDTVFEPPVGDAARDDTNEGYNADGPVAQYLKVLDCIYCGCTEDDACETDAGPCSWISKDPPVCSAPDCVAEHKARELERVAIDEPNPPLTDREASRSASGTSVAAVVPASPASALEEFAQRGMSAQRAVDAVSPHPERGLEAFIARDESARRAVDALAPESIEQLTGRVLHIPVDQIARDPHQARDEGADAELADSVKANGVLQPVVLRRHPHAGEQIVGINMMHSPYMLVDGERRWLAAQAAKLATIPARVVTDVDNEGDRLLRQTLLNDGKRLKPLEEARTWARILKEKGWKIAQLATTLGRPKSTISDRLALLDAPKPFQELFTKGILTPAAAPIVREFREVPERLLKEAVKRALDEEWLDAVDAGVPVPLELVKNALEYQILDSDDSGIATLEDKAIAAEYTGPTCTVRGEKYALDLDTFDEISNKVSQQRAANRGAAAPAPAATPSRNLYNDEERKRQKAAQKRAELRRAQFTAVSAKMPKVLDGSWLLFVIRGLQQEMHNDSRRAVCKALGLEPQKKGKLAGFNFDAALRKHAEAQDLAGRNRLVVQLLLGHDLASGPYDGGSATRLTEVAKLLKLDLAKIKPPVDEGVVKAPPAKKPVAKAAPKKAARPRPIATFMQPLQPSPALAAIVGDKPIPRTDVTTKLWAYIKKHELQDAKERRTIHADAALKVVFGGKSKVSMFDLTKLINKHLKPAKA